MKRIIFISLLYFGIAAGSLYAQGSWVPFVTSLAGSPPQAASFLNEKFGFVETANNWYRTTDGGVSWALTHGLGVRSLLHLNFFYNTPDNIIVNGAYESFDAGLNWKLIGNPSLSESIYEQDSILYDADGRESLDHTVNWRRLMGYSGGEAIVGNHDKGIAMWGGQGFGIPLGSTLYTTDGGYTWHIGQVGVEADFGYAFPFTLTYLRAGGDGNDAIQRTTDGGATWQTVYSPLQPSWYLSDGIKGDGCIVYVQTDTTHISPAGLLRSTDKGSTWVGIGGPMCTDDAPICGVCSRGAVCFAMDYFSNGQNTLWKYTDPALLHPILNDLTIDRLFPDTVFVKACDTTDIKVRLHYSACDFIRFHDLKIDSLSIADYRSFFPVDSIIRTGFPDSGTVSIMPTVPGIYQLLAHIRVAASDWSFSDTTFPFVLVVTGNPPVLKITVDDTINFGSRQICNSGGEDSLILSNPSCQPLTVTAVKFESDTSGVSAYTVSMQVPYDILRSSPDGKITILYHPRSAGVKSGKIIIITTIGNDTIPVYGYALPDTAKLIVTKNTTIDFGTQPLCLAGRKDTVFLSDSSCISLRVTSIIFEADSSPPSEFTISTVTPYDLQFGKQAGRFILNFLPFASGIKTGRVIIKTSIGNDTIRVSANVLPDGRALSFLADTIHSPICDSAEGFIVIHNLSCRQISFDSLRLQVPFTLLPRQFPLILNSGDSALLRIRFAPSARGIQKITAVAAITLYVPGGKISFDTTLNLSGIGLRGRSAYSLSTASIAFDSISICDSAQVNITLYSTGCDSLSLRSISISGDSDFSSPDLGTLPLLLASGGSFTLHVFLHPYSIGDKTSFITIKLEDSSEVKVPVNASIKLPARQISCAINGPLDFGKLSTCDNRDTLITLTNPGCIPVQVTGVDLQGRGFGTSTSFPIIIPPGGSRTIDIQTFLDTAGGMTANAATLTINSDAGNTIAPISLLRSYILIHPVHLWLDADKAPLSAESIWKLKLKGIPEELVDVRTIDLNINYNTDLLGYFKQTGANATISADGKSLSISGSPVAANSGDSTICELDFNVYLTKDTMTSLTLGNISLNFDDPKYMECVATPQAAGIDFYYLNDCGHPSIRTFMREGNAIAITSIHPNPVENEITVELYSPFARDIAVEIMNELGIKVFSERKNIAKGFCSISLPANNLSAGVYVVRIGSASQNFVKVR